LEQTGCSHFGSCLNRK